MQTTGPRSIVAALFIAFIGVSVTAMELGAQCDPAWQAGGSVAGVVGAVHVMHEWDPDGAGPAAPVLVVGGAITAAGDAPASGIARWDPVQLASTDVVFLAFPQNGASTFAISIPAGPTFVGLPLHQQFLAFEFGATTTLIGSNGLRAVVGSY